VAGVDLGRIRQLEQTLQRVVQARGPFTRLDREVGPRRVADQQRVAGEQVLLHEEAAVLRAVAGRVQHADRDRADLQLLAVLERVERVLRLAERVDADRDAVLER